MKKEIRIAIVGCGALSRIFYLPVLKCMGISPTAIVDPALNDFKDLANRYDILKSIASVEEIIDDIDAAIIASPNYLHVQHAKLLLENGKHVLLEKPIATTEKEVKMLLNCAKQFRVVLQPAMMRRFWKINKAVKKMLLEETLGDLQTISMQEGGVLNWPVQSTAIFNPKESLGGVFMDTGSHTLDLLNWWVQDENYELYYEDDNHGGVDADCRLDVNFKTIGVKAEIRLSRIRNMPNEFSLTGTKGWIKLKPWGNTFETSGSRIEKYIYNHYSLGELKQQNLQDLFTQQVKGWLDAIHKNVKPIVDAESVLPSIRMLEEGYKSRRQMIYAWN